MSKFNDIEQDPGVKHGLVAFVTAAVGAFRATTKTAACVEALIQNGPDDVTTVQILPLIMSDADCRKILLDNRVSIFAIPENTSHMLLTREDEVDPDMAGRLLMHFVQGRVGKYGEGASKVYGSTHLRRLDTEDEESDPETGNSELVDFVKSLIAGLQSKPDAVFMRVSVMRDGTELPESVEDLLHKLCTNTECLDLFLAAKVGVNALVATQELIVFNADRYDPLTAHPELHLEQYMETEGYTLKAYDSADKPTLH